MYLEFGIYHSRRNRPARFISCRLFNYQWDD